MYNKFMNCMIELTWQGTRKVIFVCVQQTGKDCLVTIEFSGRKNDGR